MKTRDQLAEAFGITWFDYQIDALNGERLVDSAEMRACLYYRTGAGKSYTALALLVQAGVDEALVVAPPAIHAKWVADGRKAGIKIRPISHAKYRQKGVKFSRLLPVVIDEFHMLGGYSGTGWTKLRVHSRSMQAPLIILSATPNYNDAERVYCVEHVLNPVPTKGGYLEWIYKNCETEQNHFGIMPKVVGFWDKRAAKEHLADLPHVYYVEDPNEDFDIVDVQLQTTLPQEFEEFGIDRRSRRLMASRMERDSVSRKLQLVDETGLLWGDVTRELLALCQEDEKPTMVFCARAEIARAAGAGISDAGWAVDVVTFNPKRAVSDASIEAFKNGELDVLVGTATMSTGVDGLDKVCDTLVLLDDTDDEALRRQVIGRILPRGADSDVSKKKVFRLLRAFP